MDGGHAVNRGLVTLGCGVVQCCHQPISHCGVMVDKLCQGAEAALSGHIHLVRKAGEKLNQLEKRSESFFVPHGSEDTKLGCH